MNQRVTKLIVITLAILGAIVVANFFHELYHVYDVKDQEVEVTEICIMNVPLSFDSIKSFNIAYISTIGQSESNEIVAHTLSIGILILLITIILLPFRYNTNI